MHFESDCLQMVKLFEEEDFWPSLASQNGKNFSISVLCLRYLLCLLFLVILMLEPISLRKELVRKLLNFAM